MKINLADYDVDPVRGFLPSPDPLIDLPPQFSAWNEIGRNLPDLLLTGQIRRAVEALQTPDLAILTTSAELERAFQLISAVGMAYIYAEPSITRIPAALAVPWAVVAEKIGRPPICSHASLVLNNWRKLDPQGEIEPDNLACVQLFLGGMDEQWFFTATAGVEAAGAPAIVPIIEAKEAARNGDAATVMAKLREIRPIFIRLNQALMRIYDRCDPYIFYNRIRPFLAGWTENGMLFEGVGSGEGTIFKLSGGSAAQSSLIQAFDVGLGIQHLHPESGPFLMDMRNYMPVKHRAFLEALAEGPSIYQFVQSLADENGELTAIFNQCIDQLDQFRKAHMQIAVRYVLQQGKDGEDGLGTGGTSFVPFLSEARKETKATRIV